MKVFVTFALESEFAPWRSLRAFRRGGWAGSESYSARIGNAEIGVILTGVGPRNARLAASGVPWGEFDSLGFCVSSGLAGALRLGYGVGQILAARNVLAETPRAGAQGQTLASSGPLISFAGECGATVVEGFCTTGRVIARADQKQHLGEMADAVDMESFDILRQAAESGVPGVAIRAVSDVASEELPLDMNRIFNEEGKVSIPRVMGQVALHPQAFPGLVRLGQQCKHAAESLARFLDRYVATVVERVHALDANITAATR